MNPKKSAGLNKARKPFAFKLSTSTAMVALALSSMSAIAGPGKVCLDGVTPLTAASPTCAAGTIGTYYANSPLLRKFVDTLPNLTPPGANKFGVAGKPGEYIPVAVADTTTYPGSEYFIIGVVEHAQWMHSDLQKATTQRSYVQLYPKLSERPAALGTTNPPTAAVDTLTKQVLPAPVALKYPNGKAITWPGTTEQVYGYDNPHYLGPIILTLTGVPVRTKMVNFLPTGRATLNATTKAVTARNGDMFLPVDETLAGAGVTPAGDKYPQNRVAFHLHGGDSPWISDGTPHQWVTAVGDPSPYKAGNRFMNAPDMPFPGDGAQTIFWPNDQSSRLMWYHDHTFGLTRQNAYAGAAAGYVIMDAAELALLGLDPSAPTAAPTLGPRTINGQSISKAVPNGLLDQIVLVVQDKTWVPNDIAKQDSKWDTIAWGKPGDLWYPHVYEPFELWGTAPVPGVTTPADSTTPSTPTAAANPAGRWDYALGDLTGAYLPPTVGKGVLRVDPDYGPVAFPDGTYAGGPSATPESYMDTPVVNGVAYPVMNVEPKAYRVRFLNGANDRYWNLSLWQADATQTHVDPVTKLTVSNTEVKIVKPGALFADGVTLNTSNDPAGVPDPSTAGPAIIQFANEAGFLPKPVVHKPTLMSFDRAGTEIAGDFYLGGAERADTVIDFSQFAGKTLIMYNDSTAPVPGGDTRYDYYTGDLDQTTSGGAPSTLAGFGPNTRTVMQIVVAPMLKGATAAPTATDAYDPNGTGGALATELPRAYAAVADTHIVAAMPLATDIDTTNNTIMVNNVAEPLQIKTIQGFTDPNVGRLIAQIGTELPSKAGAVTMPLAYIDAPTDIINAGDTQYWWIKNNDVDNHPMHFHLFNVQVLAHRLHDAAGTLRAPESDEMGWKETVKNWPGEDVIVALRPKTPQLPFGLPNSVRTLDPTLAAGASANSALYGTTVATATPGVDATPGQVPFAFSQYDLDPKSSNYGGLTPAAVINSTTNFGWEYVWHCHILGHEENDLMRPMVFKPVFAAPAWTSPNIAVDATGKVTWTDSTPALDLATKGDPANEIGFRVERAVLTNGVAGAFTALTSATPVVDTRVNTLANATSFQATPVATIAPNTSYRYQVAAVNEGGVAVSSTVDSAIAGLAAPTSLAAGTYNATAKSVPLSWANVSTSQTGVVVQRAKVTLSTATGAPTGVLTFASTPTATSVQPATATSYADATGLVANTMYQYRVYGVNSGSTGPEALVYAATATTLPAPTMMQSGGNSTTTTVALQWQNVTSAVATGYEIQHCVVTGTTCSAWAPVPGDIKPGTGATNKVVISGLVGKTTYKFQVRTINTLLPKDAIGEPTLFSPWTAAFQAKTL
jgi:FtsP/CotA-like multicopper oxidase with cupredoxin domain